MGCGTDGGKKAEGKRDQSTKTDEALLPLDWTPIAMPRSLLSLGCKDNVGIANWVDTRQITKSLDTFTRYWGA